MLDNLIVNIKRHEGFRGEPYKDHLGFPTIGYGTKLPLSRKEATVLARMRLNDKIENLKSKKPVFNQLPIEAQEILSNMAYQLGVAGLLKFRKTWKYLEEYEFEKAGDEMLDSLWAKQTPERAIELSDKMKAIKS